MTQNESQKHEVLRHEVPALPEVSTLSLTARQRALGRLAKVKVPQAPDGTAQADLAGDLFYEMFQREPQARPEIPPERSVNRQLMDWMKETHGWEESRASTVANLPASMTAAGLMWSHLTNDETLQEALKRQQDADTAAKDARAQEQAADAMDAAADAMEAGGDAAGADALRAEALAAREQADLDRQNAQQMAAEAQAMIDDAREKPLQNAKMARAAKQAAKDAKDVAEAAAGWGMGAGSVIQTDPAAAQEFLANNAGKIAQIARLAGRMRGFALQARAERAPQGITPRKAGLSQDLMRVFPTELAFLRPDAPPTLRAQAMAQFVESGLLGYVPTGDAEEEGPFVGAVDVSPSMRGAREIVAKAVALGVAQVAKMDGREYVLMAFASDRSKIIIVRSTDSWQAHLKWAAASVSGGTDFDMALDVTMELLAEIAKADCLFISDGEAGVESETQRAWGAFQDQTGSRLFYVPVGRGGYIDIEDLADRTYEIAELDEAAGADLAGQLGRWI